MTAHRASVSTGLFQIPNLDRPGCAEKVSNSLKGMEGVLKVGINFVTDNVYVSYDPVVLAREQVRRTIVSASDNPPRAYKEGKSGLLLERPRRKNRTSKRLGNEHHA